MLALWLIIHANNKTGKDENDTRYHFWHLNNLQDIVPSYDLNNNLRKSSPRCLNLSTLLLSSSVAGRFSRRNLCCRSVIASIEFRMSSISLLRTSSIRSSFVLSVWINLTIFYPHHHDCNCKIDLKLLWLRIYGRT